MTLGVSDLQSDSDLDSIRNSCNVFLKAFYVNHGYLDRGYVKAKTFEVF